MSLLAPAERYAHHRSAREEKALARLHELEERARHIHRQVESYGQDFRHTESDFRELRRAYTRSAYAMHDLHAVGRINREFDRLSDAMYYLELYVEDIFGSIGSAHGRYRDWGAESDGDSDSDGYRRRQRRHARIVLPRVRVSWDWLYR